MKFEKLASTKKCVSDTDFPLRLCAKSAERYRFIHHPKETWKYGIDQVSGTNYPLSLDSTLKTLVLLNIATNLITLLEEKKPLARSLSLLTTHLITGEVKDLLSIPFSFKKHKKKPFKEHLTLRARVTKTGSEHGAFPVGTYVVLYLSLLHCERKITISSKPS